MTGSSARGRSSLWADAAALGGVARAHLVRHGYRRRGRRAPVHGDMPSLAPRWRGAFESSVVFFKPITGVTVRDKLRVRSRWSLQLASTCKSSIAAHRVESSTGVCMPPYDAASFLLCASHPDVPPGACCVPPLRVCPGTAAGAGRALRLPAPWQVTTFWAARWAAPFETLAPSGVARDRAGTPGQAWRLWRRGSSRSSVRRWGSAFFFFFFFPRVFPPPTPGPACVETRGARRWRHRRERPWRLSAPVLVRPARSPCWGEDAWRSGAGSVDARRRLGRGGGDAGGFPPAEWGVSAAARHRHSLPAVSSLSRSVGRVSWCNVVCLGLVPLLLC